ncbi:hypothetical protein HHK36_013626 [Tetracentron sinense]|uniref:BED-type domain-containing protein n=1 Tax=Tetracentron sinense TaxID=13715 RepID=A0A834Z2F0_TETSI|nr:hypothetical protein HHK36_013626 [Tetracentron sinense]
MAADHMRGGSSSRPPDQSLSYAEATRTKSFVEATNGVMDLQHLLLRFTTEEDYLTVYLKEYCYINGLLLRFIKWTPNFSFGTEPSIVPIWISLPNLPLHLFQEKILRTIGSAVGKVLCVDGPIKMLTRPNKARICVDLDISKTKPNRICLGIGSVGRWQKILYEKEISYSCKQGHLDSDCRMVLKNIHGEDHTDNTNKGKVSSKEGMKTWVSEGKQKVKEADQSIVHKIPVEVSLIEDADVDKAFDPDEQDIEGSIVTLKVMSQLTTTPTPITSSAPTPSHSDPVVNPTPSVTQVETENPQTLDELSKNPSTTEKRLTSTVWEDFKRTKNPDGSKIATCKHCQRIFNGDSSRGTSHLRNHAKRCNLKVYHAVNQQIISKTKNVNETTNRLSTFKFDQERSRLDLARWIVKHEEPFNVVEHEYFQIFLGNLQPLFKLVSRNTIKSDVMKVYEEEREKLYSILDLLPSRISLTTDMWTSGLVFLASSCFRYSIRRSVIGGVQMEGLLSHGFQQIIEKLKLGPSHVFCSCLTFFDHHNFTRTLWDCQALSNASSCS